MEHVIEEPRTRITVRVSDKVRVTLEQVAELLGATVNQFVVQTAYEKAQRVIERESVIRLSQRDARAVLSLLDNPPKPNEVSGVRLGRLVVAREYQRQGIGKTLVVAAMEKFSQIFNAAGGIGFFVDAKDHDAKRYYEMFGFISLPSNQLELFLPVRTIQEALAPHP